MTDDRRGLCGVAALFDFAGLTEGDEGLEEFFDALDAGACGGAGEFTRRT